ncbi:MAG: heat-shock protein Hsp20 [Fervidicoccus fontis]|nr:MAG: heat-shock protein Hsp20 [Fervidicoccus fontis]
MSYKKKRTSPFDLIDDFFKEIEDMFEEEFERMEKLSKDFTKSPLVYGFRMTIGPDGVPHIEEFGNVKRVGMKPKISEEREPLVDIFESGNLLTIVAELPGVEKDKIDVKVVDSKLIIRASNGDRKYYKEIELPKPVKPETAKAQYKNGVLEVKIELKEWEKEEGHKIKIE